MEPKSLATITLLTLILSCVYAVPQAFCTTLDNSNTSSDANVSTLDTGSTFQYQVNPQVSTQAYGGGFLANTVFELRNAYDLNPLYAAGYDGRGQTVVIVDAYGSPTIYQDLLLFTQWQNNYGANLPWTSLGEIKQHLHIYYPLGKPAFDASDPNQIGWSDEVTLDVDMVHAIAPKADIALVIAPNDNDRPVDYAVSYAINHHLGSTLSLSWGVPEFLLTTQAARYEVSFCNQMFQSASNAGITVFAGTGDWGASNGGPINNAFFPASNPYVTAVGGTNLFMTCSDGYREGTNSWDGQNHVGIQYNYEIAGNDYQAMVADGFPAPMDMVTAGGAQSMLFPLPNWQKGITLTSADGTTTTPTGRCIADVSFDSGAYGGLGAIFLSAASPRAPQATVAGGTSAGPPFWSALTAIACQFEHHSLGFINSELYAYRNSLYNAGAFHDVTVGDNTYPTGNSLQGYKATQGWDAPTGLGSPDAATLIPKLVSIDCSNCQNNYAQTSFSCQNLWNLNK